MMRFVCWVVILVALIMPSIVFGQDPGQAGSAEVQEVTTAENIVAAYLEVIGGVDAIKAVQSKRMTYRVHMFGRDPYTMEQLWTRPNTLRTGPPGATSYMFTEGEKSWRVGPDGRKELPEGVAGSLSKKADIDGPLVDAAKKKITLEYVGVVRFDMSELHQVTLTFEDGTQWELFFDARTGLLRKEARPSYYMMNGKTTRGPDAHTYYYDYRPVGAVLYPHYWIQSTESHTHLFVVEEIELGE